VSRHLKVLEAAGLIERRVEAQWRRCRLWPEALRAMNDWLEAYRRFWEDRFDRLARHIQDNPEQKEDDHDSEHPERRDPDR